MNENAKNVNLKLKMLQFTRFLWVNLSKFGKCACVKKLTNMMSEWFILQISMIQALQPVSDKQGEP